MNREDIIRMAREAGFDTDLPPFQDGTAIALKLAALVASAEREACAKVCEDSVEEAGDELAWQIRARSNP
jgi:hypothetical protein